MSFFEIEDLDYTFVTDEGTSYSELKSLCPKCRSVDFVDARHCPRCNENHVDDCNFCEKCQVELKKELEDFLAKYSLDEQEIMFS